MQPVQLFTRAAALAAACTVASVSLYAQTPPAQPSSTSRAPSTSAQASSDDTTFAQKAATAGMQEVEHARIATQKSKNAQVKAYAGKLVKDHTAANNQLKSIATRKHIELPSVPSMTQHRGSVASKGDATTETKTGGAATPETTGQARDRMAGVQPWMGETGAAFDKGFIDAQVKAHEEAIELFEAEANTGSDAELKAFAAKQLPGLRMHLKQAQDLQKKLSTATH